MVDVRMANDLILLGTITIFDEELADVSRDLHWSQHRRAALADKGGRVQRIVVYKDSRKIRGETPAIRLNTTDN